MTMTLVRLASARRNALAVCLAAALSAGASAAATDGAGSPGPEQRDALIATSLASKPSQSPHLTGNLVPVTSCADDGSAGTLRKAIQGAADGDTIDMSDLQCSLITLQNGALVSTVPSLSIQGPGIDALTIDGGNSSRVLKGKSLDVSDLSIAHGLDLSYLGGGCIRADENLSLTRVKVSACLSISSTSASGGAAHVLGDLTMHEAALVGNTSSGLTSSAGGGALVVGEARLYDSTVSENTAQANQSAAFGGGLMVVVGSVILHHSTISNNTATSIDGRVYGGGIHAQGGAELSILDASTVSGNTAHSNTNWGYGGGINSGVYSYPSPTAVGTEHSTISGNTVESNGTTSFVSGGGVHSFSSIGAKYSTIDDNHARCNSVNSACAAAGGGLASFGSPSTVSIALINATISANSAVGGSQGSGSGGGIHVGGDKQFAAHNSTIAFNHASTRAGGIATTSPANAPSEMHSTIVANNDIDNGANDIDVTFVGGSATIEGSNDLVMYTGGATLPSDTLTNDPQLLPLTTGDGGATATHPLPDNSVAIDAGDNVYLRGCDQRGFPFHRVQGAAADIGAYEAQGEAHLFADNFEGSTAACPPAAP